MSVDLSICIVNHRTSELTRNCLRSIAGTKDGLTIETFLVNNTPDPCPINDIDLPITFIQNERPLGFAANQNVMLRRSAGRYVMPLNSDTVIHPHALQALVDFMDRRPRCGVAGPRLEYSDGRLQPSGLTFPNFFSQLLEASGRWQHFKGSRLMGRFQKLCDPHDRDMPVDWLYGACMIVRPEILAQAGLFDEALFDDMYGEDVDWMWRIHQAGWEIWFTPTATVTHLENQSPLTSRLYMIYRGARRFYRKQYSRSRQLGVRLGTAFGLLPKWLFVRNEAVRQQLGCVIQGYLSNSKWDDEASWK